MQRSKTHATVVEVGDLIEVHIRWVTFGNKSGQFNYHQDREEIQDADRDGIINLLYKLGVVIRFYDSEEKQWMEQGPDGYYVASGNRDGTWQEPTMDEFIHDYLRLKDNEYSAPS